MLRQINFDIGKVPAFIDRILNQFQQQKKTGIFEGIGSEFLINNESIDYSTSGYCKFTMKEGFATIFGGAVYNEEGTQFTPVDLTSGDTLIGLPLTTTSTGSLGIRVDLAKPAGQQASFYYKTTQTLVQQDLNALKTSGVYEFELYKHTSNGSAVTFTKVGANTLKTVESELISIKAAILTITNLVNVEILYDNQVGLRIVDLNSFVFNEGDILEVDYTQTVSNFKSIKTRRITLKMSDDQTSWYRDYTENIRGVNSGEMYLTNESMQFIRWNGSGASTPNDQRLVLGFGNNSTTITLSTGASEKSVDDSLRIIKIRRLAQ